MPAPRRFDWRVLVAAWLVFAGLATAWTLATPIGASPDEPAHLIKAASVARGQFVGEPSAAGHIVRVPAFIAHTHAQTCYAFQEDVTADCMTEVGGDPDALVDAPTTAGLYNPLYYLVVGWPSLIAQDSSGVFAMRVVSAVVVSLFLGLGFALIATWRRRLVPLIGFAVATTPMVLFLNGTVNPNSLETATVLAAFIAMLTVVRSEDSLRLPLHGAILGASAAIAANVRGLSLLWLALALFTPLLLLSRERLAELLARWPIRGAVIATAVASVAAAAWLLGSNSLGAAIEDPDEAVVGPAAGTSPVAGFVWTLVSTFRYAQGIVGIFGWLDTPAPEYTYFTWSVLAGGILVLGLVLLRGRVLAMSLVLLAALVLLPPVLQGIYITGGGVIWQGRYILPVFVCAVVAIAAGLADRLDLEVVVSRRLTITVLVLWSSAHALSFATALRRYAVGLSDGWAELLDPQWSPPGGIALSIALFVGISLAASAGLWLVVRHGDDAAFSISSRRPPS